MPNRLTHILGEYLKVKGVTAVAIVGRDGFVIDSSSNAEVDMDALGAIVATAVGTVESLGKEFNLGTMNQYLSEFANGKVVMATVLDDILAVFTDNTAVIGGVRHAIKRHMPETIQALQ